MPLNNPAGYPQRRSLLSLVLPMLRAGEQDRTDAEEREYLRKRAEEADIYRRSQDAAGELRQEREGQAARLDRTAAADPMNALPYNQRAAEIEAGRAYVAPDGRELRPVHEQALNQGVRGSVMGLQALGAEQGKPLPGPTRRLTGLFAGITPRERPDEMAARRFREEQEVRAGHEEEADRRRAERERRNREQDIEGRKEVARIRAEQAAEAAGIRSGDKRRDLFVNTYQKGVELHGDPRRAFEEAASVVGAAGQLFPNAGAAPAPPVPDFGAQLPSGLGEPFPTPKSTQARVNEARIPLIGQQARLAGARADDIPLAAEDRQERAKAYVENVRSNAHYRDRMAKAREAAVRYQEDVARGRLTIEQSREARREIIDHAKLSLQQAADSRKLDPATLERLKTNRSRIGRIEAQMNRLSAKGDHQGARDLLPHLVGLLNEADAIVQGVAQRAAPKSSGGFSPDKQPQRKQAVSDFFKLNGRRPTAKEANELYRLVEEGKL